jgi:hypothetical protein
MAQQFINKGATAGDKTGTPARAAADIINENFDEVYNAIDALNRIDRIEVSTGFSEIVSQDITIYAGWEWVINNVDLSNPADIEIEDIPLCNTGKTRLVYIVPNETNGFDLIYGEETTGSALAPFLPNNGIFATYFTVTDSEIQTPAPPIIGENFIPKLPLLVNQYLLAYVKEDGAIGRLLTQVYPNLEEISFVKGVTEPIEPRLTAVKVPNTYFINTGTGNNATGVFEDASKPFADINYVNDNFTLTQGVKFYLQGTGQTYVFNGQFQSVNQSIIADEGSTNILDFSSNTNTYAKNSGALALITVNMPNGFIRNERSGGTGIIFSLGSGRNTNTNFNVKEIYWNCSTNMTQSTSLKNKLQADKISSRVQLCQGISNDIIIQEFVCLAAGANLAEYAKNVTINLISGSGSYNFSNTNQETNILKYTIGDVTATGGIIWSGYFGGIDIFFNNSIITNFNLASNSLLKTIRGNIKSITTISGNINSTRFINFTCSLGTNTITANASANLVFENCSIKSTNSPITITAPGTTAIELKSSAFEVVNAVPLITGGASGTNTVKIAGVSTNATMLSDQNGTGVTVTQFTNY